MRVSLRMFGLFTYRHTFILLTCSAGTFVQGHCQLPSSVATSSLRLSNQNQVGIGRYVMPPSASVFRRHADAIALLNRSIDAQGGEELWHSYYGAHLVGTLGDASQSKAIAPITMDYSWADGLVRLKVDITVEGKRMVRISSPEDGTTVQTQGLMQNISNRVHTSAFLPELPAVNALLALASPEEAISTLPISSTEVLGIRLVRFSNNIAMLETIQDWFFSTKTSLPAYVITYTPDTNNKLFFVRHTYNFLSFQETNGVEVPLRIEVKTPLFTQLLTLDTSIFQVSVPLSTFAVNQGGLQ